MNRYSQNAYNLYTSYPRRIFKGSMYHSVVKLGDKKWRVLPNGNCPPFSKPEGWIVTAKKFPPDTSDFGKICYPGKTRVENREIKCTCQDATARDGDSQRDWTHTRAGLFYPCKHIVAVLIKEKVDFIQDTLKNYNRERQLDCGEQPSPPDTLGRIFLWRSFIGERNFVDPTNPFSYGNVSIGQQTLNLSNFVVGSGITYPLTYDLEYISGGFDYYEDDDIPPYSIEGTGLAFNTPTGSANIYTPVSGDIEYIIGPTFDFGDAYVPTLFGPTPLLYRRDRFDLAVANIFTPPAIQIAIVGDSAYKEYYGDRYYLGELIIEDDFVIIDRLIFVPVS